MLIPFRPSPTSSASSWDLPKSSSKPSIGLQTEWHQASNLLQVLALTHPIAAELLVRGLVNQLERMLRRGRSARAALRRDSDQQSA